MCDSGSMDFSGAANVADDASFSLRPWLLLEHFLRLSEFKLSLLTTEISDILQLLHSVATTY